MKQNFNYWHILLLLILGTIIYSCLNSRRSMQWRNVSSMYNPAASVVQPDYVLFNNTDSTSQLYLCINTSQLQFNEDSIMHTSRIKLFYTISQLDSFSEQVPRDSGYKVFDIVLEKNGENFISDLTLKIPIGGKYQVKLVLFDLKRTRTHRAFINVNRQSDISSQSFMAVNTSSGLPVFRSVFQSSDSFKLVYGFAKPPKLFVKFVKYRPSIPQAPFINKFIAADSLIFDSVWVVNKPSDTIFKLKYQGAYLFSADSIGFTGATYFNFGPDYPIQKQATAMLRPLAYFLSSAEYANILNSGRPKASLDSFWLAANPSMERAREMIKVYYNRVQYANKYFTSDREGWCTDRGMMFLVFGPPANVTQTDSTEQWVYFRSIGARNVQFDFFKVFNPFSDNDFMLDRSDAILENWQEMVEAWRGGTIAN